MIRDLITITTASGYIKPVSLIHFLSLVQTRKWHHNQVHITYFEKNMYFSFNVDDPNTISPHNKRTVLLGDLISDKTVMKDLLYKIETLEVSKDNLLEMVHDMATHSECNMGHPSHLVRLGPRHWLMTNPDNFEIVCNNKGYAFLSYYPVKSVCWKVTR